VVEFWNRYLQLIPPTDPDYPKIQLQLRNYQQVEAAK